MASARQLAANQANALRSTGPRTAEGKAVSKRNALTHGLTATRMLLDGEDPREFNALRQSLIQELQPAGAAQGFLVDDIAISFWRLRRVPAFEAALLEWATFEERHSGTVEDYHSEDAQASDDMLHRRILGRALEATMRQEDLLSKLSRYEGRLVRDLERRFNLLRKAQSTLPTRS